MWRPLHPSCGVTYGKIHEYVGFIDSTAMDDVEPAVGVVRVAHHGKGHLDETITAWDEENIPPFAKTLFFPLRIDKVDATTSKLVCVVDLNLTTFFSFILPSFLLKKKLGGKQMKILEGYKNAAETKMPV